MNARTIQFLACAIILLSLPTAHAQQGVIDLKYAQARLAAQDFHGAVAAATSIIAAVPNDSRAYEIRGQARNALKDFRGAIEDLNRALELNPNSSTAFNLRGFARANSGDPKRALEDYGRSIALDPRHSATYRNRGDLLRISGDKQGAMRDYDETLKLAPKDQAALLGRGFLRLEAGDNAGATADFTTYIASNTKYYGAYFNRGLAREKLGDFSGALEDYRRASALNPSMAAAKTRATAMESAVSGRPTVASAGAGVAGQAARAAASATLASPASGKVHGPTSPSASEARTVAQKPAPVAAQAFDSPAAGRVLAPFTGYAAADPCVPEKALAGAPWGSSAAAEGGVVAPAQLGQYQALLRHTMESLRILYGQLTPGEEKSFNAFWAPFFDHPNAEAMGYFQQITPLLDDMTVALSDLDGLLPGMGETLQGTVFAGGDSKSGSAGVAALQYQRVKTARARLDELSKKIGALGNPPNPLAAKCAARQRHRRAVIKEPELLAMMKDAQLLHVDAMRNDQYLFYSADKNATGVTHFVKQVILEWTWSGTAFKFVQQDFDFDSPTEEGGGRSRYEFEGNLSADGRTIEHITCRGISKFFDRSTKQVSAPSVRTETVVVGVPLVGVTKEPGWTEISFDLAGAAATQCITRQLAMAPLNGWNKGDEVRITFVTADRPLAVGDMEPLFAALNSEFFPPRAAVGAVTAVTSNQAPGKAVASAAATPAAPGQTPGGTAAASLDPQSDPQVNAEAIAEHLALAEQTRAQAERWAADAAAEKDSTRRKELQDRAAAMYANAQADKDVAESLRTGTLVHTRTAWDEQQHQAVVSNIKTELAVFDEENKLIANIPRTADLVGGVEGSLLREQMQDKISDAIHSPDTLKKLVAIYGEVQDDVINHGQQEITYAQDRVAMWDSRIAVAQNVEMAAGLGVTFGALWAPAEVGSLALGYAGSTGFAEGGVKGATVAIVRGVSSRADILISAYEGATKIDPTTHEPAGVWGAFEGALWSIGTNKAFEALGSRIQQAKAEYSAARQAVASSPALAPAAKAGEGRLQEFDFQTPEQRYKAAVEAAATPQEQASVRKKYAIQEQREAMASEKEKALHEAEDAVRQGTDQAVAREQYSERLKEIDKAYAGSETRNTEHQKIMEELGFDSAYTAENRDIKPTGSNPKTAESDMDFMPVADPNPNLTPAERFHSAYQKGKAYTDALKARGHNVDEYGDRWVDTTIDATIWKPGFSTDKPGNSSFDAEVIFGTLPNSDKFGTKGGIEWTSSKTHTTDDPLGAVLANAGKAVGAGLGNSRAPDLHVIGKSATKALDILGAEKIPIDVDPTLQAQLKALKEHQTPEQAGVVELGANPATKQQQLQAFVKKAQALMGQAIVLAKGKSDAWALEQSTKAAGATPEQAYEIRSEVQAYQASDKAAMDTIAQVSPGLAADVGRFSKAADPVGQLVASNIGGLSRALEQDRDRDTHALPPPSNSNDPAFVGLGKRCQQAAQNAAVKLAAAKPGSDEAKYLADLKSALEQGAKNPAEAVRSVRSLSGTELAVVLAQLGVPAK